MQKAESLEASLRHGRLTGMLTRIEGCSGMEGYEGSFGGTASLTDLDRWPLHPLATAFSVSLYGIIGKQRCRNLIRVRRFACQRWRTLCGVFFSIHQSVILVLDRLVRRLSGTQEASLTRDGQGSSRPDRLRLQLHNMRK